MFPIFFHLGDGYNAPRDLCLKCLFLAIALLRHELLLLGEDAPLLPPVVPFHKHGVS